MAVIEININKDTSYAEYICDKIADLNSFKHKENLAGCVAYVLEDKNLYIMNSNGEWEEQ